MKTLFANILVDEFYAPIYWKDLRDRIDFEDEAIIDHFNNFPVIEDCWGGYYTSSIIKTDIEESWGKELIFLYEDSEELIEWWHKLIELIWI